MKCTSGLTSASITSAEPPLPIRPSKRNKVLSVSILYLNFLSFQDRSRHFPQIASQQLPNRGHYGPVAVRKVQHVRRRKNMTPRVHSNEKHFTTGRQTSENAKYLSVLFLFLFSPFAIGSWLIDSWKALVRCAATKTPEVTSVTNAESWSTLLN